MSDSEKSDYLSDDDRPPKRSRKNLEAHEISRKISQVQSEIGAIKSEMERRPAKGLTVRVLEYKKKKLEKEEKELYEKSCLQKTLFGSESSGDEKKETHKKQKTRTEKEKKKKKKKESAENSSKKKPKKETTPIPPSSTPSSCPDTAKAPSSDITEPKSCTSSPVYSPLVNLPSPPGNPLHEISFSPSSPLNTPPPPPRKPIEFPSPEAKFETSPARQVLLFTPPTRDSTTQTDSNALPSTSNPQVFRQPLFQIPGIAEQRQAKPKTSQTQPPAEARMDMGRVGGLIHTRRRAGILGKYPGDARGEFAGLTRLG